MIRTLLVGALALALSACGPMLAALGGLSAGPAPAVVQKASAPLAGTNIDENALRALWKASDTIRASVDVLVARQILVRNSPRALQVQQGLIALREALVAADEISILLNDPVTELSAAEIADRARRYSEALRQAQAAYDEIAAAIRG